MNLNKVFFVFALGAVAQSCSHKPPPLVPDSAASDDPAVEKQFRQARDLFVNGKTKDADAAFDRLVEDHSVDPLARVAIIYRARIALEHGNPSEARRLLAPIVGDSDPVAERASFYDGIALHRLAMHQEAIERLEPFVDRLTDPEENILLLDTLWNASRSSGNPGRSIYWIDAYLAHAKEGDTRKKAKNALAELAGQMSDLQALDELSKELHPDESAWPVVMARLAALHFEAGKLEQASKILDRIDAHKRGDDPAVKDIASSYEERSLVDLRAVGCIVPLSGRARLVGETVLKGVMLGAQVLPLDEENELSVTIRNSAGNPRQAVKAVEELVFKEHVSAIIGPIDSASAKAAAARAEELGVPMLALSVREGLVSGKRFVFREFATNRGEVRELVDAARRMDSRSFAVLYPDSGYGRTMSRLMSEELKREGLTLAGETKYSPKTTTFKETIEELMGWEFDTLFIPDSAARIALIAPALAAAGLWSVPAGEEPTATGRAVQLLMPSTGYAPDLLRRAGRYLDGALFVSFLDAEASHGGAGFIEKYRSKYMAAPSYLAGFGHDATILVAAAIRSGATTREGIRQWLVESANTNLGAIPFAAPFGGFDAEGEPLAHPWILRVNGERLEVLR
ncbi:MAG: ABC transporter substrate-binding protein [Deltaproteobacteria bacterium]|nr:ABC transporter substrate-binding protein [Deltaproteobacteria bacterium]